MPVQPDMLDCTSGQSALDTAAKLLNRSADEVVSVLTGIRRDEIAQKPVLADGFISDEIEQRLQIKYEPLGPLTAWWHLGSALSADDYRRDGLLATRDARPRLIKQLHDLAISEKIADEASWDAEFTASHSRPNRCGKPVSSSDYGHDAGPHGFLFKHQCKDYLDYYSIPEVVCELCSRLGNIGEDLRSAYTAHRTLYIVRFCAPAPSSSALTRALLFAYWSIAVQPSLMDSVTYGYCGHGDNIPPSDILSVTRVQDNPGMH